MQIIEGLGWEGKIDFAILDQEAVQRAGLLDDIPRLLKAIRTGELAAKRHVAHNKVTNVARANVASLLVGNFTTPLPSQMQLGTGSGTPSATDTDLWNPSAGTLKLISGYTQYLQYFAQYLCTWLASDPIIGNWTEIGLKDSTRALWAHANVTGLPTVNAGEMLIGQWAVQLIGN